MSATNRRECPRECVRMRGIEKRYGAVRALERADFSASSGEISAIVGENGAGKTTLVRILAGLTAGDAGEISVDGKRVSFASPRDAARIGIGIVEQECRLIGGLSVYENVILGDEGARIGLLRRRDAGKVRDVFDALGTRVRLDVDAAGLSPSERQRVAIARAVCRGARILILDEPTSLLGPHERDALFAAMRLLAASSAAVIFISHKLAEVFEVADTITVLRHGRTLLSRRKSETSPTEVAAAMIGEGATAEPGPRGTRGGLVARLAGVSTAGDGREALKNVTLEISRGEVVGIAGVAGNGQRALADVAIGLLKPADGTVVRPSLPGGVCFVGEDVSEMDLVPGMSVWENCILGREGDFAAWGTVKAGAARERARALAGDFEIKGGTDDEVRALSGGNRQRLALARELSGAPHLFVAHEPTRGLDIMAAEFVRKRIRDTASAGGGVLLISYDLDELYAVADRILVISSGRILEPSGQPPLRAELGSLMGA